MHINLGQLFRSRNDLGAMAGIVTGSKNHSAIDLSQAEDTEDLITLRQKLAPAIEKLEIQRQEAIEKSSKLKRYAMIFGFIYVPIAIYVFFFLLGKAQTAIMDDYLLFGAITVLPIAAFWGFAHTPIMKYRSDFKETIIPEIFAMYAFSFHPKGGLSMNALKPSEIIPRYDRETQEDYFRGTYQDVDIEGGQVHLEKRETYRDSKGNRRTRYDTVFKGLYISFTMPQDFNTKVFLRRNHRGMGLFSKYEKIDLEDPEFEDKFDVYGTDQIKGRVLLTTAFMERLLRINRLFGEMPMEASFSGNRLLVAIQIKGDMFEAPSVKIAANDMKVLPEINAELQAIFNIVDTLKLNKK